MRVYKYYPVEEELKTEEGESYITWGLEIILEEDDGNTLLGKVSDVSLDYEKLNDFSKVLTNNNVRPDYISELIEDFIG